MYDSRVLVGPVPAVVEVGIGEEKKIQGGRYFSFLREIPESGFVEILILGEIASRRISALVEIRTRMEDGNEVAFVVAKIVNLGANPIFKLQVGPLGQIVDRQMPRIEMGGIQIGFA
ncbi:MAG: hypothetical protein Q8L10_00570 [Candidatus Moranbacteria bacterium]|nr:hypothetical protein [Candidatus Moranbacteria bacterium]